MREGGLRNVNWRGALKQKGTKQTGVKRGLSVYPLNQFVNVRIGAKFSVGCVNFKLVYLGCEGCRGGEC
jgi:hypothetical protein